MKFQLPAILFLALSLCGAAAQLQLKELKVGSRVYRNVTVLGANASDIYFTHESGIANVKLKYLHEELQRRFNYDAQAATEAERQQAEEDSRYKEDLAIQMQKEHLEARRKEKNANASSPDNLSDAISDQSVLGKPLAKIEPEKWLGKAPTLEGKPLLALFWAPWSHPSRKAIAQINAIQKSFAEKLVVIGITTEPESDVKELDEVQCEFPVGLDPEARITSAFLVTSIPEVVIANASGTVVFKGHPAVINSTNLSVLISPKEGSTSK